MASPQDTLLGKPLLAVFSSAQARAARVGGRLKGGPRQYSESFQN